MSGRGRNGTDAVFQSTSLTKYSAKAATVAAMAAAGGEVAELVWGNPAPWHGSPVILVHTYSNSTQTRHEHPFSCLLVVRSNAFYYKWF